jgi:hypothetical protein
MKNKIYILLLLLVLIGTTQMPCAYGADSKEYKLKAAFIYNFVKFISWPEDIGEQSESIRIAIIGDTPFGKSFDPIVKKMVKNKKIEVAKYHNFDKVADSNSLDQYQVIFICESESKNAKRIIKSVSGKPVLVISDVADFADLGGMIGFVERDNKIRFEINLDVVKAVDFRISSQLLKLALRVIEKPQGSKGN